MNLDPSDVEYILQKSATDIHQIGYDDTSGWGRLNAYKALKMIDFPKLQIVHPNNEPTNVNLVNTRNTVVYVNSALIDNSVYGDGNAGPLSTSYTLNKNRYYDVDIYEYNLTYNFSNPYFSNSTTKLIDTWVRHSQTNSLANISDTFHYFAPIGNTGQYELAFDADTIHYEPNAEIIQVDSINKTITLKGFYYHFNKRFDNSSTVLNNDFFPIDFWYPINPSIILPKMAFSIYIEDSTFTERFDFPCDSLNPLIDLEANLEKINVNDFSVFPNPGEEQITIQLLNILEDSELNVYSMNGIKIESKKLRKVEKNVKLNTEKLDRGIYIIEISNKNQKIIKKWVKN